MNQSSKILDANVLKFKMWNLDSTDTFIIRSLPLFMFMVDRHSTKDENIIYLKTLNKKGDK